MTHYTPSSIPDKTHAPVAWEIATGGTTAQGDQIVVAVLDQGFDLQHPDINYWHNEANLPGNGFDVVNM